MTPIDHTRVETRKIPENYRLGEWFVPKGRYLDRDFLELEVSRLFPRSWTMACREEEIQSIGDYFEYELAGITVVVVRTRDGLRAYHNACRHRGTRLCEGTGRIGEFRCPFHGWRWHLDGTLKFQLQPQEFDARTPEDLALVSVNVDTWGGWVFINMENNAGPLLEYLSPLPELFAPYKIDQMRHTWFKSTIMGANWKTVLEAFKEAYHVPGSHPQTRRANLLDKSPCTLEELTAAQASFRSPTSVHKLHARMYNEVRGQFDPTHSNEFNVASMMRWKTDDGWDVEGLINGLEFKYYVDLKTRMTELDVRAARKLREIPVPPGGDLLTHLVNVRRDMALEEGFDWYELTAEDMKDASYDWSVFPNMVILVSQGTVLGYRTRPNGLDPDSCIFDVFGMEQVPISRLGDPPIERQFIENWQDHDSWGQILEQDFFNVPHVTAGMHSPSFKGYNLNREQESSIYHHHVVADRFMWD